MPTLLKIWKTGNQEGLASKAGAARTPASYSIPEDDDEEMQASPDGGAVNGYHCQGAP